jgi:hypothetical protein
MKRAKSSNLGGFTDWRIPTAEEFVASSAGTADARRNNKCARFDAPHPLANGQATLWEEFLLASGLSRGTTDLKTLVRVAICTGSNNASPIEKTSFTDDLNRISATELPSGIIVTGAFIISSAAETVLALGGRRSTSKGSFVLVRGGSPSTYHEAAFNALNSADANVAAVAAAEKKAEQEREIAAERSRREYEARQAKEQSEFSATLRSSSPRPMYLAAVRMEDSGDRGKAKTVYRELMKRFPNAQETLLASQRLTRLGDVEAVESASSSAAARTESAAQGLRSQNYQQCISEESSCYSRCSDIRNSSAASSCRSGCFKGCKQ